MSTIFARTGRVKSASTEAIHAARQITSTSKVLFDGGNYRDRLPHFGHGIEEYFAEVEQAEAVEVATEVEPSPALRVDAAHEAPAPHFGRISDMGPAFDLSGLAYSPETADRPSKLTRDMTAAEFADFLGGFVRKLERNKAAHRKPAASHGPGLSEEDRLAYLEGRTLTAAEYWARVEAEEDAWLMDCMPGDVLEDELELRLGRV